MMYMDNAATTLHKPKGVAEAVVEAMSLAGNAGRGTNQASLGAARIIYDARERLCRLFGAESPKQIAFTSNSTEALNTAIRGLIHSGDHVITTVLEHNSVLRPLYERERSGAYLSIIGCDEKGNLLYKELEDTIGPETKAIVCTHGSNMTGNMVDLRRVSRLAKKYNTLLIVDASQTAGVYPIPVQEIGIDVLCFTGHKGLLGPQGTGGLYVREGLTITPLKCGGTGVESFNKKQPDAMPAALEAGTLNGHGIAGLAAALAYLEKTGLQTIREKELALMRRFYEGITQIPAVKVYGDFETQQRCPIVSFNIGEYDSAQVSDELLMEYDIATRPGAHCAPLMHKAFGTEEQGAVRFSFSHYNTEEEVDQAIQAVRQLAEEQ